MHGSQNLEICNPESFPTLNITTQHTLYSSTYMNMYIQYHYNYKILHIHMVLISSWSSLVPRPRRRRKEGLVPIARACTN